MKTFKTYHGEGVSLLEDRLTQAAEAEEGGYVLLKDLKRGGGQVPFRFLEEAPNSPNYISISVNHVLHRIGCCHFQAPDFETIMAAADMYRSKQISPVPEVSVGL